MSIKSSAFSETTTGRALALADDHWFWLERSLRRLAIDFFVHGYKHSRDDIGRITGFTFPKPVEGGHSPEYCLGYEHGHQDTIRYLLEDPIVVKSPEEGEEDREK